jgi:hypothetical protein
MRSAHSKRVFFFLSAGWGPVVRALPIINRLADYGIASSLAIHGAIGPRIRAAGLTCSRSAFLRSTRRRTRYENGGHPTIFLLAATSILRHSSSMSKLIEKQYQMDAPRSSSQISIRLLRLRLDRCKYRT